MFVRTVLKSFTRSLRLSPSARPSSSAAGDGVADGAAQEERTQEGRLEENLRQLYGEGWRATRPVPLYEGHVRTSPLQKLVLACHSATTAMADPTRADAVAVLGETTGALALRRLQRRMARDPIGAALLAQRRRVTEATVDLHALRALPRGSFGREYAEFMASHAFSPDERAGTRFVDDAELAYVATRLREVHDFWHVLCGLPPSVVGELALKWFEMAQAGLPGAALAAFVGPLGLPREERAALRRDYIPWAARAGRGAAFLLNVDYEAELASGKGLQQLREELRIEPFCVGGDVADDDGDDKR